MHAISFWAHRHKWPARLLIVLLHLLLAAVAVFIGRMLLYAQVEIPFAAKYGLLVPALVLLIVYPTGQKLRSGWQHAWLKVLSLSLLAMGFLIVVCMGNNRTLSGAERTFSFYPAWGVQPTAASVQNHPAATIEKPARKKALSGFKIVHKKIKAGWQQFRKQYKASSQTGKVALIILSILVATGLMLVISALSCSIACNGSGVLAAFVLLAGGGLVILGLVKLLQRIKRGPKPKQPPLPATPVTPTPLAENNKLPPQGF